MNDVKIRQVVEGDLDAVSAILDLTKLFPSEMLAEMFAGDGETPAIWLVAEAAEIAAFCYAAPEPMTEGVWNMLALAVAPAHQRGGYGAELTTALTSRLRGDGARIMVVDTSSGEDYLAARSFYAAQGFAEEARIRDFWAEGEDKVMFWKRL